MDHEPVPPLQTTRVLLEKQVLDVVADLVRELRGGETPPRISSHDSLERDLGISSLERVELLVRLERVFGIRLGDAAMIEADTPIDLTAALLTASPAIAEPRLEAPHDHAKTIQSPTSARTIIQALEWHAERNPDRVHIRLREDAGGDAPVTYGHLWRESMALANGLRARGLQPRDTVAVMLRTEKAFFPAFFGTLLAGCIPVPIYPPFRADRIEEYAQRQVKILHNAEAKIMVTFAEVERLAALLLGQVPSMSAVVTAGTLIGAGGNAAGSGFLLRHHEDVEPALIQYTSGSTGQPKGVLLSHANLLANIRALQEGLEVRSDDVVVSWLPLYHDMGLIGAWLGTLYVGAPLVLMSPLAFLARPARWLWSLHTHGGTFSQAPNFAYDLCSQRVDEADIEGLDLSAVRMLLNGAEAVHPETLRRFSDRFEPYGLRPGALAPVYGLAECSVGLAAPPVGRGPRVDTIERRRFQETGHAKPSDDGGNQVLRFVSCGRALPRHEIRIVTEDGEQAEDRHQGHVQFRGPSATAGYYRNPEATRELVLGDGWLRTGDLGYLVGGELFLTARHKDLIIKGGRNLQPHEAEAIVATVPGVRKGCDAAFGVSEPAQGTERFVIVAETRVTGDEDQTALKAAIIDRVAAAIGLPPDVVVLSGPGTVPKTSSGKIKRGATRDAYRTGQLLERPPVALQWTRLGVRAFAGYLQRLVRSIRQATFTVWVAALLVVTAPWVWLTVAVGPSGAWINRLIGRWTRLLFRLAGCRIEVAGLDHIRDVGQAVYVANHASFLDPVLIMGVIPVRVRFAVKGRLLRYPFLGTAIRKGGHIPLNKGDLSERLESAGAVMEPLQAGESLFVFPEGTFVGPPGLLPFRLGAFRAAVDTRCPIVPIAIRGTRSIFPAGTRLLKRGPITVTIGHPIQPNDETWPEIVRLRDVARDVISAASGEMDTTA